MPRSPHALGTALLCAVTLLTGGCVTGAYDVPRTYSTSMEPSETTALAEASEAWKEDNGAPSGFAPLVQGSVALGTRLQLIQAAESSIDAQYFLMKPDTSGHLFAAALADAARRGVRVRFLLDDLSTPVKDASLYVLDQNPNIEVRLFNPIGRGVFYWGNFLVDFKRTNRRMHNKTLIADNRVGIIGGRNIGDEYFELRSGNAFLDFDMFLLGDAAQATSLTFDQFWNHPLSVPMSTYTENISDKARERALRDGRAAIEAARATHLEAALDEGMLFDVIDGNTALLPGTATAVTDSPDKLLAPPQDEQRILVNAVKDTLSEANNELLIFTPYLIPGKTGVDYYASLVQRGLRVAIVTNSLASNNHVPVHGAYGRYRKDLLNAAVELYEVRVSALENFRELGSIGDDNDAGVGLHTKAIIVDRRWVLAGSLNLDPRAVDLNTEFGLLIDSPPLAEQLAEAFEQRTRHTTWRLALEGGDIRWHATIDGEEVTWSREPEASWWRRFLAQVTKILPEQQL